MNPRKLKIPAQLMLGVVIAFSSSLWAQQPEKPEAARPEAAKPETTTAPAPAVNGDSSSSDTAKPSDSAKAPKTETLSPAARLAAARSVFVKRTGGSDIPYTVIGESIKGWGHFVLASAPEKADLILEVEAPEDTSGLTFGGSTKNTSPSGEPDRSSSTWMTRQTTSNDVKLTVREAKSGSVLWRALEQSKSSIRKTNRENSLVEAAERLFVKFHDRIEPPPPVAR